MPAAWEGARIFDPIGAPPVGRSPASEVRPRRRHHAVCDGHAKWLSTGTLRNEWLEAQASQTSYFRVY